MGPDGPSLGYSLEREDVLERYRYYSKEKRIMWQISIEILE